MDTKNLLVFLAGAAVAYFVIKEMDKQKALAPAPVTPTPTPAPVPSPDMCDFPQPCQDGTFGCDCADHGGYMPAPPRPCDQGQFGFGNSDGALTCLDPGNYRFVLLEDTALYNGLGYQQTFRKNTMIEAILWAPVDFPEFITSYDARIPRVDIDGDVWFTLPTDKIDFSQLTKIG